MRARDIPNLITLLRIVLVVPVAWAILQQHYLLAFVLFLLAGVSDALDGFLAKRFAWVSRLGAILDPLADKLLLVTSYLALAEISRVPVWLVLVIIARDLIILLGATLYYHFIARIEAEPTILSKINTLLQIVLVLAVLAGNSIFPIALDWVQELIYAVFATTALSGSEYIWIWGWRAWNNKAGSGRFP
ncbi:MAG: CDP-alcohol phosphatidyltransferase family protein [Gammaproteobacteria bacterium]|nr:CDP-alcohol phosphatidyltransferase family protein [Gammaproteobacteria bacterium]